MSEEEGRQMLFTEAFVFWLVDRLNIAEDDVAKLSKKMYHPWKLEELVLRYIKESRKAPVVR